MDVVDFPTFRPHALLRSGHAQTIAAALLPQPSLPFTSRTYEVELDDQDRLALHDDCPPTWQEGANICLLVHGLGGSHQSPYMQRIAAKLIARGVRVFRMDHRGCGAGATLAQHPGHAGRSDDVLAVLRETIKQCPGSSISLIGFSLGGNMTLKMLGEGNPLVNVVEKALVVAPPIDLLACATHMQRWINRPYNRSFLKLLFQQLQQRSISAEHLKPYLAMRKVKTIFDFDDQVTAPLSGFRDAVDYYTQSSSAPLLQNIDVPTSIVAAADDPLIPVSTYRDAKLSSSMQMLITERGGHVGYLSEKGADPDRRWIDWRVLDWMDL